VWQDKRQWAQAAAREIPTLLKEKISQEQDAALGWGPARR